MDNQKEINKQEHPDDDCFDGCDGHDDEEGGECDFCAFEDNRHEPRCPNDDSPFARFRRDGYD
jgi:hypothetical protein